MNSANNETTVQYINTERPSHLSNSNNYNDSNITVMIKMIIVIIRIIIRIKIRLRVNCEGTKKICTTKLPHHERHAVHDESVSGKGMRPRRSCATFIDPLSARAHLPLPPQPPY